MEGPPRPWPRAPTSMGSPNGVPVPCTATAATLDGCTIDAAMTVLQPRKKSGQEPSFKDNVLVWILPASALSPMQGDGSTFLT